MIVLYVLQKKMNSLTSIAFLQHLHPVEVLVLVATAVLWVIPAWMICKKAGYPAALGLLVLVPLVNVIMVYFVAFSKWPVLQRENEEVEIKEPPLTDRKS